MDDARLREERHLLAPQVGAELPVEEAARALLREARQERREVGGAHHVVDDEEALAGVASLEVVELAQDPLGALAAEGDARPVHAAEGAVPLDPPPAPARRLDGEVRRKVEVRVPRGAQRADRLEVVVVVGEGGALDVGEGRPLRPAEEAARLAVADGGEGLERVPRLAPEGAHEGNDQVVGLVVADGVEVREGLEQGAPHVTRHAGAAQQDPSSRGEPPDLGGQPRRGARPRVGGGEADHVGAGRHDPPRPPLDDAVHPGAEAAQEVDAGGRVPRAGEEGEVALVPSGVRRREEPLTGERHRDVVAEPLVLLEGLRGRLRPSPAAGRG